MTQGSRADLRKTRPLKFAKSRLDVGLGEACANSTKQGALLREIEFVEWKRVFLNMIASSQWQVCDNVLRGNIKLWVNIYIYTPMSL